MLILVERIEGPGDFEDTLTLSYDLRQKSRQRVRLDGGDEAALMLPPEAHIEDGDCLLSADGRCVRVSAALEDVTTAATRDPNRLARACYHLGNRHVALQVGEGWVRYQPDHVLDEMVERLGLTIRREPARFEPERGAYHGHSHRERANTQSHSHAGNGHPQ